MAGWLARRLSYANVVSTLCLFIVLSGAAYAAARITSADIADNTVASVDLRNNGVRGKDVKDRSLGPVDFRAGSLPAGPRGEAGPAGPAGANGSSDTAEQVKAKLQSVDGPGSGLDADLLDGQSAGAFVAAGDRAGGDVGGTFEDLQLARGSVTRNELASGGPFGTISFFAFSVPAGNCERKVFSWDAANLGEIFVAFPESTDLGAGMYMRPTVVAHPGEVVMEICNATASSVEIPFGTFFQLRLVG